MSSAQSSLHIFQPSSVEEAHALLAASTMPVDSPTQRRIRTDQSLADYFESERRRPEWVWAVRRDDDSDPLGVIGAFGTPSGVMLLDVFGLPDDADAARALVARATADVVSEGEEEALLFTPPGLNVDDDALASVVTPLRQAGWRLLVERRHYEFVPPEDLAARAASYPTTLRFEQVTDPADPRLKACHREVMRDTLDAHDRALVQRLGFDGACAASLDYLVTADPVDRIHLAFDDDGEVAGMVSGHVWPSGRGSVLFVGVCRDHRGRGLGRQLLAWQRLRHLAAGATALSADTDDENVPMARAFADVGWPQTETRIDFVHGD